MLLLLLMLSFFCRSSYLTSQYDRQWSPPTMLIFHDKFFAPSLPIIVISYGEQIFISATVCFSNIPTYWCYFLSLSSLLSLLLLLLLLLLSLFLFLLSLLFVGVPSLILLIQSLTIRDQCLSIGPLMMSCYCRLAFHRQLSNLHTIQRSHDEHSEYNCTSFKYAFFRRTSSMN